MGIGYRVWGAGYWVVGIGYRVVGIFILSNTLDARMGRRILDHQIFWHFDVLGIGHLGIRVLGIR